jgi:hypothetical protein
MFGLPTGVPVAGYGPRGFAEAVANIRASIAPGVPAVLLANHGVLVFHRTPELAILVGGVVEEAAQAGLNAGSIGGPVEIPEELRVRLCSAPWPSRVKEHGTLKQPGTAPITRWCLPGVACQARSTSALFRADPHVRRPGSVADARFDRRWSPWEVAVVRRQPFSSGRVVFGGCGIEGVLVGDEAEQGPGSGPGPRAAGRRRLTGITRMVRAPRQSERYRCPPLSRARAGCPIGDSDRTISLRDRGRSDFREPTRGQEGTTLHAARC